jgi:hypothetical protein
MIVVEELRQKKFRPFPNVAKVKVAGEMEDVEENDKVKDAAASSTSTDYDYPGHGDLESHEREGAHCFGG